MAKKDKLRLSGLLCALAFAPALALQANASDDLQWLEPPHDEKALSWARKATSETLDKIGKFPSHSAVAQELTVALNDADPQPSQFLLGDKALRFSRDTSHPFGLLQMAKRDARGLPGEWKTVLDVEALRKSEDVPYEFQAWSLANACLAPDYNRCLLRLAPGGGDEVEIREFDLEKAAFVKDGFTVGKSRAFTSWLDPNKVLVMTTLNGDAKTAAGWPAIARTWQRGQKLTEAAPVYQAKPTDALIMISTAASGKSGKAHPVISRFINYSTIETNVVDTDGKARATEIPHKIKRGVIGNIGQHLIFQVAEDATLAGKPYKAESILAYDMDPKTPEEKRFSLVYAPAPGEFIDGTKDVSTGKSRVSMVVSQNLQQRVITAELSDGRWSVNKLLQADPGQVIRVRSSDKNSNELVATFTGFVTPNTQFMIRDGQQRVLLARDSQLINPSKFVAEVGHATSPDGTVVDYYLLRPSKPVVKGPQPVLMTGYGAFGISILPDYFGAYVGGPSLKLWLERGGSLVIPAIRGGGERGEAWHMAAIRDKRQNSYDDFIAVAENLIDSGYTKPGRIGVFGSSNGGLLAAVMGTQRPDLFGAIVSDVPVADLFRMKYMGMGAAWLNEYGDAADPEMAKVLGAYSPVHNVHEGVKYPPFLVTISTEDNRVGPGHARKLAHQLMEVGADTYFYEDEEGGHGVSDPLRNPELMGLRMSFFIDSLITPSAP